MTDSTAISIESNPVTPASPPAREHNRFIRALIVKILMGILCSILAALIMNAPQIRVVVQWVCQGTLLVLGRPGESEGIEKKIKIILQKAEEKAEEVAKDRNPDDTPQPAEGEPGEPKPKSGGFMAPVKNAATEVKAKGTEVVETVKDEAEKVGNKIEQLDKIGEVKEKALTKQQRKAEEARLRKEAAEAAALEQKAQAAHAQLIADAVRLGVPHKDRTDEEIREDIIVKQAESGPNAQCPNPRCRFPLKIGQAENSMRRCPNPLCRAKINEMTAKQLGPPRGMIR